MKILAINASHRGQQGHTHFLIERIFQGASEAGGQCEEVTLARLKINRCLGCERCHTPASYLRCVYDGKDDVRAVFDKIAGAEVVIYATPVYVFGMSGLMKIFLDRINATSDVGIMRATHSGLMFHHIDPSVCSKPLVSLVCCDNLEDATTRNAVSYFRTYARFMDAPLVGELVRNGGRLMGHGDHPERAAMLPGIPRVYAAFEQAGRELAQDGCIRRATQRRASQEIVPVPLFGLLKRIPSRALKEKFVERAEMLLKQLA